MGRRELVLMMLATLGCGGGTAPDADPALGRHVARLSTAIGDVSALDPIHRAAFEAHLEDFPALPEPGPDDWLALHPEPAQSVRTFWAAGPNRPGKAGRDTLYIQPLGPMPDADDLRAFAADFFGLPVVLRPSRALATLDVTRRLNDGTEQLLAPELLRALEPTLPENAYAMLGLTMVDLYPGEQWNFVYGYASTRNRTGVFSLARYAETPERARLRAFKVLAHEAGHMFGIHHCVHAECVMNGINHVAELDRSPLLLCPVCLRKLHRLVGFDPARRYEELRAHHRRLGFERAEALVSRRLERLRP